MKTILLKKCSKPLGNAQKKRQMELIGRVMFENKEPGKNISLYKVQRTK